MSRLTEIAERLIPDPDCIEEVIFEQGDTQDIIDVILYAHQKYKDGLSAFAPKLKAYSTRQTLRNVWSFVKKHIEYKADEPGLEEVKSPLMTWCHKYADCKSFSLMVGSLLEALGINFVYRFSGRNFYPDGTINKNKDVTHVYVVAIVQGREIVIDSTLTSFDYEANADFIFDYDPDTLNPSVHIAAPTFKPSPMLKTVGKVALVGGIAWGLYQIFKPKEISENAE